MPADMPYQKPYNPNQFVQWLTNTQKPQIQKGDTVPNVKLTRFENGKAVEFWTQDLLDGKDKYVVLITLPGAYTPVCSSKHLPGLVEKAKQIKALGVAKIVCLGVDNRDVMRAWHDQLDPTHEIEVLPDWGGQFTHELGIGIDGAKPDKDTGIPRGIGFVADRAAFILKNKKVVALAREVETNTCELSAADGVIKLLNEAIGAQSASQNQAKSMKDMKVEPVK